MSGPASVLTPSATVRSASMSRPESVSSRTAISRLQHRQLEDLHALLLAAREAVVEVAAGEVLRDVGQLHRLLGLAAEVLELDLVLAARLAVGVDDHPQVLGDRDAGDRDRVLEGHEEAQPRALVGVGLGDVLAVEVIVPSVTSSPGGP